MVLPPPRESHVANSSGYDQVCVARDANGLGHLRSLPASPWDGVFDVFLSDTQRLDFFPIGTSFFT